MDIKQVYHNQDGIRRTVFADSREPDKFTIFTENDMTEVVEGVKRLREAQPETSINKHLARIPMVIYEKSLIEQWDDADWKKWLNDPDNAAFRIWQGRV